MNNSLAKCVNNTEKCGKGRKGGKRGKGKKCMRPGPITSNGYLNFLREYRKKHCGLTPVEVVRRAAKEWNKLSCAEKKKYRASRASRPRKRSGRCSCTRSKSARKRSASSSRSRSRSPRKRSGSCSRSRSRSPRKRSVSRKRSRSRKNSRSCSRKPKRKSSCKCKTKQKSSKKCHRPGPVTRNAFLNFLRCFRKTHCGLTAVQIAKQGAKAWCKLTPKQKAEYKTKKA